MDTNFTKKESTGSVVCQIDIRAHRELTTHGQEITTVFAVEISSAISHTKPGIQHKVIAGVKDTILILGFGLRTNLHRIIMAEALQEIALVDPETAATLSLNYDAAERPLSNKRRLQDMFDYIGGGDILIDGETFEICRESNDFGSLPVGLEDFVVQLLNSWPKEP